READAALVLEREIVRTRGQHAEVDVDRGDPALTGHEFVATHVCDVVRARHLTVQRDVPGRRGTGSRGDLRAHEGRISQDPGTRGIPGDVHLLGRRLDGELPGERLARPEVLPAQELRGDRVG